MRVSRVAGKFPVKNKAGVLRGHPVHSTVTALRTPVYSSTPKRARTAVWILRALSKTYCLFFYHAATLIRYKAGATRINAPAETENNFLRRNRKPLLYRGVTQCNLMGLANQPGPGPPGRPSRISNPSYTDGRTVDCWCCRSHPCAG